MPIVSLVAIYFVVWWLCLFLVLPFRGLSQAEVGKVFKGSEPGAPALLRLWPKILINSVLAAVVTGLILWGLTNPLLREYWR